MSGPSARPPGLTGSAYLQLVGLGVLVGVPAALLAAVFLALVHELEDWLWDDLPRVLGADEPPWYLVVVLPVVGAAIVAAARLLLPGDGGRSPLGHLADGPTPVAHAPGVALAAVGTLAFGAVLGPEMPLIALGSVVGVALATLVRVAGPGRTVLGTAGSFAAISALFGGPLVAGMLLVEAGIGTGTALLATLLPGLVAAAVGYLLFTGLGSWGGLPPAGLTVPGLPEYHGTRLLDLAVAIAVGIIAAVVIVVVRRLGTTIAATPWGSTSTIGVLLAGGLVTGLLALAARALGADSQAVLFSGQASIPELVTQPATGPLLVLLAAKAVGYGVCLGCGFRGGPVFPPIFLGIGLCALATVLLGVSPTAAVAIGTAAGMAASTRLLLAPVLFATLLVGTAGIDTIPAAVLATASAWLTAALLDDLDRRARRGHGSTPAGMGST